MWDHFLNATFQNDEKNREYFLAPPFKEQMKKMFITEF
jgi:hypothetical protein